MKEKQAFERLEVKKETLLEMFKYNKFKCRILNEKVNTPTTTVYRCGPLIDLCRGPHVRHTGKIKTLKIHKNSSTYWEGKADMETLQRIYGISFPDPKMLKEWEKFRRKLKTEIIGKLGGTRNSISSMNLALEVAFSCQREPIFITHLWNSSGVNIGKEDSRRLSPQTSTTADCG